MLINDYKVGKFKNENDKKKLKQKDNKNINKTTKKNLAKELIHIAKNTLRFTDCGRVFKAFAIILCVCVCVCVLCKVFYRFSATIYLEYRFKMLEFRSRFSKFVEICAAD